MPLVWILCTTFRVLGVSVVREIRMGKITTERPCLLRQADNQMKLCQCSNDGLGSDDLQVEKAVVSLARQCPSQSLVSGMASITLVNYPPPEVAKIPLRRMRILTFLRLQANVSRGANYGQA